MFELNYKSVLAEYPDLFDHALNIVCGLSW